MGSEMTVSDPIFLQEESAFFPLSPDGGQKFFLIYFILMKLDR